jgi:mannose-1-phosphate guanylyltransferase/mannose-1-phosphate guanylyltransferase/phosphomannomutase
MQAVIVAGGKGTRLRPFTYRTPKPMMPLFERPFLAFLIERCRKAGVTDIILNVHYNAHQVQEYFQDGSALGVTIRYSIEASPLDTCGAVKHAEEYFTGVPLLVLNADILTDLNLEDLIAFHRQSGGLGTIALARVPDPTAYGLVELDVQQRILSFREKPTAEQAALWGIDTINAGTYVLEPEVFAEVSAGVPWSFERKLFPQLVESKRGMRGFLAEGYWLDIGNPQKYAQAHWDILTGQMPYDLLADEIAPGVWVGSEVELDPKAQLITPCFIGARCKIGPEALIGPRTVLGEDSWINGSLGEGIYPPATLILS